MKITKLKYKALSILLSCFAFFSVHSQTDTLYISLTEAINIANDSSLQAFIAKNQYYSSYWQYNSYKANKLPQLNFSATPIQYNRSINKQYSWTDSGYVYLPEQTLNSSFGLNARQNLTPTGGTFYINSDLHRLQNLGSNPNLQYTSTWLSIGYSQPLFGYNSFKWQDKTAPLEFLAGQREFIEAREAISLRLIPLFFSLADAIVALEIAEQNHRNADTLYKISERRFQLASVNKADLLTIKLDLINSVNQLKQANNYYSRAQDALHIFLRLHEDQTKLILPETLPEIWVKPEQAVMHSKKNYARFIRMQKELIEAEQNVQKTKVESRFNASLDASFGLNKYSSDLPNVFVDPLDQQMLAVSLNIPLSYFTLLML